MTTERTWSTFCGNLLPYLKNTQLGYICLAYAQQIVGRRQREANPENS